MLRFASVGNPGVYFTQHLAKGDYFLDGQDGGGVWQGKGAERLGLEGEVQPEDFAKLCQNRVPGTDQKLTPRDGKNRRVGVDLSFHCPKSVSLLYGLSGDDAIKQSVQEAVQKTMREMERETQVRVRKGKDKNVDENRTTGNLIWGEFVHKTARPVDGIPDPHLHVHCYVFNASYDQKEDRFKAAQLGDIRRNASYYEACFHSHLADELSRQGYEIETTKKGWEIAGIERETVEKFSARTKQVEERAKEKEAKLGRKLTDKERDGLAAETRSKKEKDIPFSTLRETWASRLNEREKEAVLEIYHDRDPGRYERQAAEREAAGEQAVDHAFLHCLERKSVVGEKKLLTEALKQSIGRSSQAEVNRGLDLHESALRGKDARGERMVTTYEVKAEEEAMLAFAREGKGSSTPLNENKEYEFQYDFLNAKQREAVAHVMNTKDRLTIIQGKAGVGKTTTIKEAAHAIEQGGKAVFTFAPTSDATKVLQEDGFENAATVSRLLVDEKLQEKTKGQVIWIDEAGLVSSKMMGKVFEIAKAQNARVVLSGDTEQHHSVERGDAMRQLVEQARLPIVNIDKIQRQQGKYREAVEAASQGKVGKSFETLDGLGWVQEIGKEKERGAALADGYIDRIKQGRSALVVSPTHREKDRITKQIREGLKAEGIIKGEEAAATRQVNLNWTEAERKNARNYEAGQTIQFTQNCKGIKRGERMTIVKSDTPGELQAQRKNGERISLPLEHAGRFQVYRQQEIDLAKGDKLAITQNGFAYDDGNKKKLVNGMIYEVDKVGKQGGIHLKNGWTIGKDFGHIDHGYCTTSHKAQGKTVDHVFLAQSSESNPAASREQFYVSISRGRKSVTIYTDDKAELKQSVYQSDGRLTALEMEAQQRTREQESRFAENRDTTTAGDTGHNSDQAAQRPRTRAELLQRQEELRKTQKKNLDAAQERFKAQLESLKQEQEQKEAERLARDDEGKSLTPEEERERKRRNLQKGETLKAMMEIFQRQYEEEREEIEQANRREEARLVIAYNTEKVKQMKQNHSQSHGKDRDGGRELEY